MYRISMLNVAGTPSGERQAEPIWLPGLEFENPEAARSWIRMTLFFSTDDVTYGGVEWEYSPAPDFTCIAVLPDGSSYAVVTDSICHDDGSVG